MRVDYEPNLIENAVFEAGRLDPKLEAEIHRATDPLYDLPDERKRNDRLQAVYITVSQRLKLDGVIPQLLAEHALIKQAVRQCIVREALRPNKEAAELHVKSNDDESGSCTRIIIIHVCPHSLLNPAKFIARMRSDLLQIVDMIDERFGYRKESLTGRLPRENLIRDRYRVLWAIYTEGRIAREGPRNDDTIKSLSGQFERVFSGYPAALLPGARRRVFKAENLTHPQLLEWAGSPEELFEQKSLRRGSGHAALGEPCPLCGFSTYDWFDLEADSHGITLAIQEDFPQWQPEKGLCRQCAEIYRMATQSTS